MNGHYSSLGDFFQIQERVTYQTGLGALRGSCVMVAVPRLGAKGSRKAEMRKSKFRDFKQKEQELGVHLRAIVFKRTGVQSLEKF